MADPGDGDQHLKTNVEKHIYTVLACCFTVFKNTKKCTGKSELFSETGHRLCVSGWERFMAATGTAFLSIRKNPFD